MYPPPEIVTSNAELLGTTTGIVLTAVVAFVGLAVFLSLIFWADAHPAATIRGAKAVREGRAGNARGALSQQGGNGEDDGSPGNGGGSPGQGHLPSERVEDRHVPEGRHPHGTMSSWILVAAVTAAFAAGGVATTVHVWWLFWACAGVILLAIPVGKMIGIMNDTVSWGPTPAAVANEPEGQAERKLPAGNTG